MRRIEIPFLVGDVWERMAGMDDGSVDLVLTSPPFLALRSYLPPDHPDKAKEIGSEPTPAEFLDTLLRLTAEWGRLVGGGSIAVELGDTYSGSGGGGGDYLEGGLREGQPGFGGSAERAREGNAAHWRQKNQQKDAWPLPKSLCFIPQLYGASLAYGRNLLTGEPSPAGQWRVRNVVRWVRPNPPVGKLGDKYRPGTSEMIVATKCAGRWFDLDAVREPHKGNHKDGEVCGNNKGGKNGYSGAGRDIRVRVHNPAGAPPLDWWEIPTAPYKGAHYATWPPALCERPIKSMCPERVCRTCGKAAERITGEVEYVRDGEPVGELDPWPWDGGGKHTGKRGSRKSNDGGVTRHAPTPGWSDCGHDDWRPGVVLDPFAGSGTTLAVATGLGRAAIGIDLDEQNVPLARERCRMTRWIDEAGNVFWTTKRGKNHLLWRGGPGGQAVGGKVADAEWKHADIKRIAERYGLTMDGVTTLKEQR